MIIVERRIHHKYAHVTSENQDESVNRYVMIWLGDSKEEYFGLTIILLRDKLTKVGVMIIVCH